MRVLTIVLCAFAVAACGPKQPGVEQPRTVVEVDNRGFNDMTIYLLEGGGSSRTRIGTAGGLRKTTITIPPHMVSGGRELQFLADPLGGTRNAVSTRIYVRPGERVTLMIPSS